MLILWARSCNRAGGGMTYCKLYDFGAMTHLFLSVAKILTLQKSSVELEGGS